MLSEITKLLATVADRNGGILPEQYRIAWQAYLSEFAVKSDIFDHNDYIELRDLGYFSSFDTDPDSKDPVLVMSRGKHYRRVPAGGFIHQTRLEELTDDIEDEVAHFCGQLPAGYTVALSARFLALHDLEEITDEEYEQLKTKLPALENDPVKEVEDFTRKYMDVARNV